MSLIFSVLSMGGHRRRLGIPCVATVWSSGHGGQRITGRVQQGRVGRGEGEELRWPSQAATGPRQHGPGEGVGSGLRRTWAWVPAAFAQRLCD